MRSDRNWTDAIGANQWEPGEWKIEFERLADQSTHTGLKQVRMPVPSCFYSDYSHQFSSQSSYVSSSLCVSSSFCISALSPQPQLQFSFRASDLIRHFLLPVTRRLSYLVDSPNSAVGAGAHRWALCIAPCLPSDRASV